MAETAEAPFPNMEAGYLQPGWRVYRLGQWHTITKVRPCFGRAGQWMVITTDEDRIFHVNPKLLVAGVADP